MDARLPPAASFQSFSHGFSHGFSHLKRLRHFCHHGLLQEHTEALDPLLPAARRPHECRRLMLQGIFVKTKTPLLRLRSVSVASAFNLLIVYPLNGSKANNAVSIDFQLDAVANALFMPFTCSRGPCQARVGPRQGPQHMATFRATGSAGLPHQDAIFTRASKSSSTPSV